MKKIIKRFFEPIFIEKKYLYKTLIMRIIQWFAWVFNIFMIQKIISIFENQDVYLLDNYIWWYALGNIILYILIYFTRNWSWGETTQHIFKMLHRNYMKQLNDIDNNYIENIWVWKIISIYSKWTYIWTMFLMDFFEILVKLIFSLWASIIILYSIWIYFIVLFFLVFLLVHIIVYIWNEKAKYWRESRIEMMHEYDKQIIKIVMSKFEILQNSKMQREVQVLDTYIDKAKYYNIKLNSYLVAMMNLPSIVFFIFSLVLIIVFTKINLSFASIVSMFMILWLLKENMYSSINFFKNITKDSYQIFKVWSLFDEAPKIEWLNTWKDFEYKSWNINIKNLDFSYWENKVFENLSLDISWSKKTALVWISWSWKTTLVKLVSGFIRQKSWDIIIDWQNLAEINLKSYYKNIWYLTQEPSVFDGTILENLIYWLSWDYSADNEELNKKISYAIKLANAEFIYKFKDWLNTEIWERWVRLSGWQKQRLAIAKLFIKDPKIIILDEPTSALDSFSEEDITSSFEKLFSWRTVLIIAHRLQTVKNSDDIIVFDEWKIIERWTHEDLIKKGWYYKKMLDLQSGF